MFNIDYCGHLKIAQPIRVDSTKNPIPLQRFANRETPQVRNSVSHVMHTSFTDESIKKMVSEHPLLTLGATSPPIVHNIDIQEIGNITFLTALRKTESATFLYLIQFNIFKMTETTTTYALLKKDQKVNVVKGSGLELSEERGGIIDSYIDLTDAQFGKVFIKSRLLDQSIVIDMVQFLFPYSDGTYDAEILKRPEFTWQNPSSVQSKAIVPQNSKPISAQFINLSPSRKKLLCAVEKLLCVVGMISISALIFTLLQEK